MTLYHGTTYWAAREIEEHGLEGIMIYATTDEAEAERYAVLRAEERGDGPVVIKIAADMDFWTAAAGPTHFVTFDPVPPTAIRDIWEVEAEEAA